jgi:hypothetical protein
MKSCTAAILMLVSLAGCAEVDRYPVSGEACAPGDPVQDVSSQRCPPSP